MGLIAADLHNNNYIASGSVGSGSVPVAIYYELSEVELERTSVNYIASGGFASHFFTTDLSGSNNTFGDTKISENNISRIVKEIRSVFGLTKKEFASVCQIKSRKTLYNWIDGVSVPRKKTMGRMFDLRIISEAWVQSALSIDKESLHQPVLDGVSIYELLMKDILDKELILFAGSRLNMPSMSNNKLKDPFA